MDVLVHNIGAGHNIPTGVTELRQMWVELTLVDAHGRVLFQSGVLDPEGKVPPDAIHFGAVAVDVNGKETVKLWEMHHFLWKKTIPPKSMAHDTLRAQLPNNVAGPLVINARLFYRSVSPDVVKQFMPENRFSPKVVEMARATRIENVE